MGGFAMSKMRRFVLSGAVIIAGAMTIPLLAEAQSGKTLRLIPEADLRSLDPIWTTAYITRNYGYMVYDTLFAFDAGFKPQPQMVKSCTASDDHPPRTFTLRPGLKCHNAPPVPP